MTKQPVKLYEVHVAARHETLGTFYARIGVGAKKAATATRLAEDSAARRYRIHPSQVDTTHLTLIRSTDWKSEKVYRYHH